MATHRSLPGPLLAAVFVGVLAAHGVAAAQNDERTGQAAPRDGSARNMQTGERGRGRAGEIRFRAMDVDNDGVITRAEWQGSDQSFRQQDTNADGVLSGAEIAPRPSEELRRARRDELVAQFTRADRNSDARLRRNEWTADLGSFEQADANRDGMITRAEFLAAHRSVPGGTTENVGGSAADLRRATPAFQAGFDKGLIDGRQAGKEDRTVNGGKWDLEGQRELEQADAGYETSLGRRVDYQAGYRAGFRRGYTEGFGPR